MSETFYRLLFIFIDVILPLTIGYYFHKYKIISLNEIQNYEYDFIVISVIGREIDIIKNLMEYNNIDIKKVIIL